MLESILTFMNNLDPFWIYVILISFSFIENVFPPAPSDVVVIIGATLIASTTIGFFPILILTSFSSALGFILMYYVGKFFGDNILRKGKIKFIHRDDLEKTNAWFNKYGYKLIVANRFLPGTRSVISFFSGAHQLNVFKTFFYASISAFAWNAIIIYLGFLLGQNVDLIASYLKTYSNIILIITVIVILFFVVRYFIRKKKTD
ncbi:MAG: DedA family protein [Melioribacteraceae bacterium]|nr:MAG: DedA family protein [Melioribacteraceae bacterium]